MRGFAPPPPKKTTSGTKAAKSEKKKSQKAEEMVEKTEEATPKEEETTASATETKESPPSFNEEQFGEDDSEQKRKRKEQEYEDDEEFEQKAEFKAHRRFMFILGKIFKYTCWLTGGIFLYHYYLVTNKDKPEAGFGANEMMLYYAYQAKGFYHFLKDLLTKPPVNSLLMERPPAPPGYNHPKTLVLNVSGTLTHSEYKVSSTRGCAKS